jgi:hypothetical protein
LREKDVESSISNLRFQEGRSLQARRRVGEEEVAWEKRREKEEKLLVNIERERVREK